MSSGDTLVSVRGVSKSFGQDAVLKDVDLELPRGSVTALLGRNGCGKSTLVRILTGLLARDGGTVEVLGRAPEDLRPRDWERIAIVNDASGTWKGTLVRDELALIRGLRGARWSDQRAKELLLRFGVPVDKKIGELSKGQQARLRLVLALAGDPELLILDEPALGLDLFARHDLLEAIIETVEREGRAILIASHLIDDIERVADRIVFLRHGVVEATGSTEELRDRFRRVRVRLPHTIADHLKTSEVPPEWKLPDLLGVRRVPHEPTLPADERVVVFDDFSQELLDEVLSRCEGELLETRRMSLREIYFEVLAGGEEGVGVEPGEIAKMLELLKGVIESIPADEVPGDTLNNGEAA